MSDQQNSSHHNEDLSSSLHWKTFFVRLQKNLILEILGVISILRTINAYVTSIIYGVIAFFLGIAEVKSVAGFVIVPILIYCIGVYLTLLPTWVVFVLIFAPARITWSVLGLAIFFSFFIVFLV